MKQPYRLACQNCTIKFDNIYNYKKHVRGSKHQQEVAKLFHTVAHKGPVHFAAFDVLDYLNHTTKTGPVIGLGLVTMCITAERYGVFYLCHVCEEKLCSGEAVIEHLFSSGHYFNYFACMDPDKLFFAWISKDTKSRLEPAAQEEEENARGCGKLQVLQVPSEVFKKIQKALYSNVMKTLMQTDRLEKCLREDLLQRKTIQRYSTDPNRKHPLIGLHFLVHYLCSENKGCCGYLCMRCRKKLSASQVIAHIISFDHLYWYLDLVHPGTLEMKSSYVHCSHALSTRMQDLANQVQRLHPPAEVQEVQLDPSICGQVVYFSYLNALEKLQSIRKKTDQRDLKPSIVRGERLVYMPEGSVGSPAQEEETTSSASEMEQTSATDLLKPTDPQNTQAVSPKAFNWHGTICCLVCNNSSSKYISEYKRHVRSKKHKQELSLLFGPDVLQAVGHIPEIVLYQHLTSHSGRNKPVIGLSLMTVCVNIQWRAMGFLDPTFYLCHACQFKCMSNGQMLITHIISRQHYRNVLAYTRPDRVPFGLLPVMGQEVEERALEEERDEGGSQVLQVCDLSGNLYAEFDPLSYHKVMKKMLKQHEGLKECIEVEKPVTLQTYSKSPDRKSPLLGLQFMVKYSATKPAGKCGFLCLLCERKIPESRAVSHVLEFTHVHEYLAQTHPGSLASKSVYNCYNKALSSLVLNLANQAERIHSAGAVQEVKLDFADFHKIDSDKYSKAKVILQSIYNQKMLGDLMPSVAPGDRLVPSAEGNGQCPETSQQSPSLAMPQLQHQSLATSEPGPENPTLAQPAPQPSTSMEIKTSKDIETVSRLQNPICTTELWDFLKRTDRAPVIGLSKVMECNTENQPPFYVCMLCEERHTQSCIISHLTCKSHRRRFMKSQNENPLVAKRHINNKCYEAEAHALEKREGYGAAQVLELEAKQYWEILQAPVFKDVLGKLTAIEEDKDQSHCDLRLGVTSNSHDPKPEVTPKQSPEDVDPTQSSTGLWTYLTSPTRSEPVIANEQAENREYHSFMELMRMEKEAMILKEQWGLSMVKEYRTEGAKSMFLCKCFPHKLLVSSYMGHLIGRRHRTYYIEQKHPELCPLLDQLSIRKKALSIQTKEGWGRLTVISQVKPGAQEGHVTMETLKPSAQKILLTKETVEPSAQEVPVTKAVKPSAQEVPATTKTVKPSAQEGPVTTKTVKPSAQKVPVTTKTVKPSAQEVTVTKEVKPGAQEGHVTMETLKPSAQKILLTKETVEPSAQEVPVTKETLKPSAQEVPATTKTVKPSAQEGPVTTKTVKPSAQKVPVTTKTVKPSAQEVTVTKEMVKPSAQEVPATTKTVKPSAQEGPVTTKTVNPSAQKVPVTTKTVKPSAQEVTVTMDVQKSSAETVSAELNTTKAPKWTKPKKKKHSPVVGLNFLLQVRHGRQTIHFCELCSNKIQSPSAHMTSVAHRNKYVILRYPDWNMSPVDKETKLYKMALHLEQSDRVAGRRMQELEVTAGDFKELSTAGDALSLLQTLKRKQEDGEDLIQRPCSSNSNLSENPDPDPHTALDPAHGDDPEVTGEAGEVREVGVTEVGEEKGGLEDERGLEKKGGEVFQGSSTGPLGDGPLSQTLLVHIPVPGPAPVRQESGCRLSTPPQVYQFMPPEVGRSNVCKFLQTRNLFKTEPIIGLGYVVECRAVKQSTFFLCLTCEDTLNRMQICNHMTSRHHQDLCMAKLYSNALEERLRRTNQRETSATRLDFACKIALVEEGRLDAQVITLGLEQYKHVQSASFNHALDMLQRICEEQNLSLPPRYVTSGHRLVCEMAVQAPWDPVEMVTETERPQPNYNYDHNQTQRSELNQTEPPETQRAPSLGSEQNAQLTNTELTRLIWSQLEPSQDTQNMDTEPDTLTRSQQQPSLNTQYTDTEPATLILGQHGQRTDSVSESIPGNSRDGFPEHQAEPALDRKVTERPANSVNALGVQPPQFLVPVSRQMSPPNTSVHKVTIKKEYTDEDYVKTLGIQPTEFPVPAHEVAIKKECSDEAADCLKEFPDTTPNQDISSMNVAIAAADSGNTLKPTMDLREYMRNRRTVEESRREAVVGLSSVIECSSEDQTAFYLCVSCHSTLSRDLIINHLLKRGHRLCYLRVRYPCTRERWEDPQCGAEQIATDIERDNEDEPGQLQEVLLDPTAFSEIKSMPYKKALAQLQRIRRKQNMNELQTRICPKHEAVLVKQERVEPEEITQNAPQYVERPKTADVLRRASKRSAVEPADCPNLAVTQVRPVASGAMTGSQETVTMPKRRRVWFAEDPDTICTLNSEPKDRPFPCSRETPCPTGSHLHGNSIQTTPATYSHTLYPQYPSLSQTNPTSETRPTDQRTLTNQKPTNPTQKLTNPTQKLTNPTQKLTNPTQKLTNLTQKPTNPTQKPTNPTPKPTKPTPKPTNPAQKPTSSSQKPTSSTQKPTSSTQKPTNQTQKNTNPTQVTKKSSHQTKRKDSLTHTEEPTNASTHTQKPTNDRAPTKKTSLKPTAQTSPTLRDLEPCLSAQRPTDFPSAKLCKTSNQTTPSQNQTSPSARTQKLPHNPTGHTKPSQKPSDSSVKTSQQHPTSCPPQSTHKPHNLKTTGKPAGNLETTGKATESPAQLSNHHSRTKDNVCQLSILHSGSKSSLAQTSNHQSGSKSSLAQSSSQQSRPKDHHLPMTSQKPSPKDSPTQSPNQQSVPKTIHSHISSHQSRPRSSPTQSSNQLSRPLKRSFSCQDSPAPLNCPVKRYLSSASPSQSLTDPSPSSVLRPAKHPESHPPAGAPTGQPKSSPTAASPAQAVGAEHSPCPPGAPAVGQRLTKPSPAGASPALAAGGEHSPCPPGAPAVSQLDEAFFNTLVDFMVTVLSAQPGKPTEPVSPSAEPQPAAQDRGSERCKERVLVGEGVARSSAPSRQDQGQQIVRLPERRPSVDQPPVADPWTYEDRQFHFDQDMRFYFDPTADPAATVGHRVATLQPSAAQQALPGRVLQNTATATVPTTAAMATVAHAFANPTATHTAQAYANAYAMATMPTATHPDNASAYAMASTSTAMHPANANAYSMASTYATSSPMVMMMPGYSIPTPVGTTMMSDYTMTNATAMTAGYTMASATAMMSEYTMTNATAMTPGYPAATPNLYAAYATPQTSMPMVPNAVDTTVCVSASAGNFTGAAPVYQASAHRGSDLTTAYQASAHTGNDLTGAYQASTYTGSDHPSVTVYGQRCDQSTLPPLAGSFQW